MRPVFRVLTDELTDQILAEARDLLCELGVTVHNEAVMDLLGDHGAKVDKAKQHVHFTGPLIDKALETAPASFKLYDVLGEEAVDLGGYRTHFTPGSAAINILDPETHEIRQPTTADYVRFAKVVSQLPNLASQATSFIPADVPETISDSYRLFLALLYGEKPVVTGAFTIAAYDVLHDLQLAVRGDAEALRAKPLCIFSCCPTSPLKWSDVTSQNVVDCARAGIPVEFISMPLSGFMAPVTLVGTVVAHAAETLSGVVISQCAKAGAPILWGGSPAVFDIRYETTPMGAIETQLVDCANNEVGKRLGLPTQAYIGLSDSKQLDAQAGFETANGATMAALSGINNVSGPGMLDFESCFSVEKLVLDNEICGMALRAARGIEPKEDFPARPHFEELLQEKHLLISKHTRRYLREEITFPGAVVNRANRARWQEEGSLTLRQRAVQEVERLLDSYTPSRLPDEIKRALEERMLAAARAVGAERLPDRPA